MSHTEQHVDLTRRQFTAAGAALAAVAAVPAIACADEYAQGGSYDVVVVGAGASGLAAAFKAAEDGAKVAVLQNLAMGSSQGFEATGLVTDENDETAKQAFVSKLMALCAYRPKRELLDAYAHESGQAITWWRGVLEAAGVEIVPLEGSLYEKDCNGYNVKFVQAVPSVTYAGAAPMLADYAPQAGIDVFFDCPASKLIVEDGRVTGVVATLEGAETLFAAKAVVLSTGSYDNNEELIAKWCPDVLGFPPLVVGRNGDGHIMGVEAGGRIEPIGHTKMIHEIWTNNAPYLMVGPDGARFCDEHIPWFMINNVMRDLVKANYDTPSEARVFSIVDANYYEQAEAWSAIDPEIKAKKMANPEILTLGDYPISFEAQTLEELAALCNIAPSALVQTVARYNKLVAAGADEDFGKNAGFLAPVDTPPFYAVQRDFNWGLSATLGGLVVDGSQHVLNENDEPIEGLFATGNVSGPFFGSIDYPMYFPGLSIGRAVTTGYVAGREAAKLA